MVARRRKLLDYLHATEEPRYKSLIASLGLRR
jgi:ribosomal protein S15P/S13E